MLIGPGTDIADEELVTLAQNGDPGAFEMLVEKYKQKAYRIAFNFTRDREAAKDLSQDAFLRAFTRLRNFDRQASFYTWFYRILVNICIDYRRRGKTLAWESYDETMHRFAEGDHGAAMPAPPDRQAMAGELSRRVGAALAALPRSQRTAFILKNHEGLSIREIAAIMEAAEGTVKVHLHRAVTALRRSLEDFVKGEIQ
jgi:RNA polymerase sigma-70 factor, ECF subfamily